MTRDQNINDIKTAFDHYLAGLDSIQVSMEERKIHYFT